MMRRLVSWLIAGVLLTAAASKIYSYDDTATTIQQLRVLPLDASYFLASSLIAVEGLLALSLILLKASRLPLYGTAGLFSLFVTYQSYRIWADIGVPCSCFGLFLKMPPLVGIFLNLAVLALTFTVLSQNVTSKDRRQRA